MNSRFNADLRTARKRLRYSRRCACGKARAHSVDQARAMAAAACDYYQSPPEPVWFYLCPKSEEPAWHWTRSPHPGPSWLPNSDEIPEDIR